MPALVSVIVPMYNSMPHLERCLESVLSQTVGDLEVICVDDRSPDGSVSYAESLSASDHRVRVLRHDENRGVSAARNTGLDAAGGRYVLFVDGDDFVDERLLELAVGKAERLHAQMAVFGFDEYYGGREAFVPREELSNPSLMDRAFSIADLDVPSTELVTPNVWRILYEREFLTSLGARFHEDLRTSEDLAFIYETLPLADRVCVVPGRLYHYRRDGGETLTRSDRGLDGYRALRYAIEFCKAHDAPSYADRHLVNIVLDVAEYAMGSAVSAPEFHALHSAFLNEWLPYVESRGEDLVAGRYHPFLSEMRGGSEEGYLFSLYARARGDRERLVSELSARDRDLRLANERADGEAREAARVRASWAFRVGRAMTWLPSKARTAWRRSRNI